MFILASAAFASLHGACSREAHVVRAGAWFYVVGRDGGYVRAADGDEGDRFVCYSLREDAQAHADGLNADSREVGRSGASPVQDLRPVEREMTPYEAGYRDGYDRRPRAAHAFPDVADLDTYAEDYGDGCQLRDDERLEQIVNIYSDGACAIDDHWVA